MSSISESDISKHRCILLYDDETVIDAVLALRDREGQDWWYLVVDLEGEGYAAARFSDLTRQVEEEGAPFLERALGSLVGTLLVRVDVVADQERSDLQGVREQAAESDSQMVVVVLADEFKGVIPVGGTRSPGGPFDEGLVRMAGRYARIPEQGVLSRRRMKAKTRKGGTASRFKNG